MFWYLHPFKTCKLVPISLNHVRLGAKEVPRRVYPKKRLSFEFEPHCQSNLLEDPLAQLAQVRSQRWVRARTGTRASAPDASAPLRAHGHPLVPPAPLRVWGTRVCPLFYHDQTFVRYECLIAVKPPTFRGKTASSPQYSRVGCVNSN